MEKNQIEIGYKIEGYSNGGKLVIIQKDKVEWSDIFPYFTPCILIIASFIFYQLTGNLLLLNGLVLAYDLFCAS
jgi:hypothetical protein